jgi:putative ABC transport system substrate-binding protein
MKRRDLLILLGGAAALCPLSSTTRAQSARRLGVIMAVGQTPEYVAAVAGFKKALASLGWKPNENLRIDERWSAGDPAHARAAAAEMVRLKPDVILAQSTGVVEALKEAIPNIPIVFVHVADPVAAGIVSSLAHPGGTVTGITNTEPSIGGKWLQLLKEAAPSVSRAAMLINPASWPDEGALFLRPFEDAAKALRVTSVPADVRDLPSVEAIIRDLSAQPGGGLVVTPDALFASHSTEIVAWAERFRLPAAYPYRYYVAQGGLLCYGVNNVDLFRQAAPYVGRILKGEKPDDLPVQQPTRFDLVLNVRTANALGMTVPQTLLARADEVIE